MLCLGLNQKSLIEETTGLQRRDQFQEIVFREDFQFGPLGHQLSSLLFFRADRTPRRERSFIGLAHDQQTCSFRHRRLALTAAARHKLFSLLALQSG